MAKALYKTYGDRRPCGAVALSNCFELLAYEPTEEDKPGEGRKMIFEVGKNYVSTEYSGDLSACIAERDGIEWTPARIKAAFNFGNGTAADFRRYIKDNAKYAYFIEI